MTKIYEVMGRFGDYEHFWTGKAFRHKIDAEKYAYSETQASMDEETGYSEDYYVRELELVD